MTPGTPVWLALADYRGVYYTIPGVVEKDHGPAFDYRLLIVCEGFEDFGSAVDVCPGALYCTWARLADVRVRTEQEAA